MLDLRRPIAYFFLINAAILIGYGLFAPSTVPLGQTPINLNLIWGCVMGAFGGLMLAFSIFEKQTPHTPTPVDEESPPVLE